jgi:hypothetical protein
MRYEIKYVYPPNHELEVICNVLSLPVMFSEIFCERRVNNIYYDTPALTDFFDAANGAPKRQKTRVRWYGDLSRITDPVLELKYKIGMAGDKKVIPIDDFKPGCEDNLPDEASAILVNRVPSLINTYKRRYFSAFGELCRITVDWDLRYYAPDSQLGEPFGISDGRTILEVKFQQENMPLATELTQRLHRHISKNSKYAAGVSMVIYGKAWD